MGTPFTVALVLLAILLGAGFAFESDDTASKPKAAPGLPIATLEARVEAIRELRFRSLPKPAEVSPAQAQRDGLEDLDRSYPASRRHADEEVLKLLGLLEPGVDLRKVSATVFGQGVAGYYDPRTKRLRVVKGAQTENRVLNEITLAHELTHALEDQRFKLNLESSSSDDAGMANLALVEGSATEVMLTYAERHFSPEQTLGGLFSSLGQDTGNLPPFVEAQLVFPYTQGQRFIQALYETGGGSWSLVNSAYRFRPPASTEQIMHPDKYLQVEQPDHVTLHASPGAGWARVRSGTWGEWATGQLIGNSDAAVGWGGDRYELWRRGSADCTAPCRDRDALVMRWRWDDRAAARRFEAALREWRWGSRAPRPSRRAASTSRSPSPPTAASRAAWRVARLPGMSRERRRAWAGAFAPVVLALALDPVAGLLAPGRAGPVERMGDLIDAERSLGWFVEPSIHAWVAARPPLLHTLEVTYVGVHVPLMLAVLVWAWLKRPQAFPLARNAFVAAQTLCALVYIVAPTAPPRMVAGLGYSAAPGPGDHGLGRLVQSPYAAMPSAHIAFALVVAGIVFTLARSRAVRVAALLYPLAVLLEIVATGNHIWLDAAGGTVAASVGLGIAVLVARGSGTESFHHGPLAPEPDLGQRLIQ